MIIECQKFSKNSLAHLCLCLSFSLSLSFSVSMSLSLSLSCTRYVKGNKLMSLRHWSHCASSVLLTYKGWIFFFFLSFQNRVYICKSKTFYITHTFTNFVNNRCCFFFFAKRYRVIKSFWNLCTQVCCTTAWIRKSNRKKKSTRFNYSSYILCL